MAELKFHLIKSDHYQEVPYHGAFGGLMPTGDGIFMAAFSERPPLPRVLVHEFESGKPLGAEKRDQRESKEGVVRMVHCGLYMDRAHAVGLRDWLDDKIKALDKLNSDGE